MNGCLCYKAWTATFDELFMPVIFLKLYETNLIYIKKIVY